MVLCVQVTATSDLAGELDFPGPWVGHPLAGGDGMNDPRSRQMVRIAALLVLAILGHGLLMADRADATGHGDRGKTAISLLSATPRTGAPAPNDACFTVLNVIKSAPLQVPPGKWVASMPGDEPLVVAPAAASVVPPHHPPDTARALLQVYRI